MRTPTWVDYHTLAEIKRISSMDLDDLSSMPWMWLSDVCAMARYHHLGALRYAAAVRAAGAARRRELDELWEDILRAGR